jgi:peptidoglycan/xylan/chitin deacetylase (PgdA/CDA1 family)
MPPWKRFLLTAYYQATRPVRCCYYWNAVWAQRLPMAVLFYHRVADDAANPWTLSNELFTRQIAWLQENFDLVSLEEIQRRMRRGLNHRPAVSITFDDGYADNCHQAIPLLIKERIPCTYFVTLQNALDGTAYAHDQVMGNSFAPNTLEQIRAMANAGIEIGAHTFTHSDLGAIHDPRLLEYEVVTAGEELARLIQRPVRYFAFPFGRHENLSREAFALARRAGYEAACSAYGGYNLPGDDPFHLQRIGVNADLIGLKNWLTFDPRKLRTRRYNAAPAAPTAKGSKTSKPAEPAAC